MIARQLCLVSACLVGLCTRYDGCSKQNQACLPLLLQFDWIPVCPEQLGGLPTPRLPAQIMGGDGHAVLAGHAMVIDPYGRDLTPFCVRGANMVLTIAQMQQINTAFLKASSPSCGVTPQTGVTAALLLDHGLEVHTY